MRSVVFALVMLATGSVLAQHREPGPGFFKGGPARTTGGGERKGMEAPRGADAPRGDARRPERMSPQDRERLRRDIDDANRRMEPRGGRR